MKSKIIDKSYIISKSIPFYSKLKEVIEIFNLKLIAIILVIFCLLIFSFDIYIPNYLGISYIQASNILSIIIGALTSILGVLIAIIVVAFNIFRKYYNFYAFRTFFKNKKLRDFITFYLLTITIAYLTLIEISNPLKPHIINLIYLAIVLFVISLWILFPYSNAIISSSQSKGNIKKIVNQISVDNVRVYKLRSEIMPSFSQLEIEENPIFVLNELGTRTLKDNDWLTSIYIISASEWKLFELLNDHLKENGHKDEKKNQERGRIIELFILIVKPIAYQAIKTEDEGVLTNVLGFIENFHYVAAQNQMAWYEVSALNDFFRNLLKKTLEAKLDNITYMGLLSVQNIMKDHLENNVPSEDEIFKLQYWKGNKNLKKSWDSQKDIQWDAVSRNYPEIISEIAKNAIELHNEEIVTKGMISLLDIMINVIKMPLGDLQKFDVVKNCCWGINDLIKIKIDTNLYGDNFYLSYFGIVIKGAIENAGKKILKTIFYSYAYNLRALAQKGMLSLYELNDIGALGRLFTGKIDENILYKESLIFIIILFDKLRETVENPIRDNKSFYVELCEQVISIRTWMKQENKEDKEIDEQIDKVLSNFKDYKELKEKLKIANVTNKWPYFE